MILRKPYAFFIKYFRFINFIMAILMGVLIYRSAKIGLFINDYIDTTSVPENYNISNYINFYSFILAMLIIIMTIAMLAVLVKKKKPIKLYAINLILYFSLMIIYMIDYVSLRGLAQAILDIRVCIVLRGLTFILMAFQIINIILMAIRTTGFDIKSFNFASDLEELEIEEKDREEFEVSIEMDKNAADRTIRKNIREFKYFYLEHKYIINITFIILLVLILFIILFYKSIYTANYKVNKAFSASGVSLKVTNAYITNTDLEGNKITNNYLLVVKIDVKQLYSKINTLNTGVITLIDGTNSYAQTIKYKDYVSDIGVNYNGEKLSTDYKNYLLVYEIPSDGLNKTLKLKINDNVSYVRGELGAKNIYVKLTPIDLTKATKTTEYKITDTINFDGSILGDSNLTINNVEINNKFKIDYKYCVTKTNCYNSIEYITPSATGNYLKTLIKLDGFFTQSTANNIDNINNIYYLLNKYGYIYYKINDKWHNHKIDSSLIKSTKINQNNIYYIEVNREVLNANNVYILLYIRNYTYKYVLK